MYRCPSSSTHSTPETLELTSMVTAIGSTGNSIVVTPTLIEVTIATVATPFSSTLISTFWRDPEQAHAEPLQLVVVLTLLILSSG
jgi:hypothetical protein